MTKYEGMKINIDGIFTSTPKSVYMTLAQKNGYYIPSYQRPFAWDGDGKTNMGDLFNSLKEGMFSDDLFALVFFGAIVLVEDNNSNLDVEPCDTRAMPSQVSVVVDGQQRLTTFTLLASRIYQRLNKLSKKLKEDRRYFENLEDDKCENRVMILDLYYGITACIGTITGATHDICRFTVAEGDEKENPFCVYPRIIRMYDDCWSTSESKVLYNSDVASYLFNYRQSDYGYNGNLKSFFKIIDQEINDILQSEEMTEAFLRPDSHLYEYLQRFELSAITNPHLPIKGEKLKHLKEIVALFYLAEFVLYRCAFTVISVTKNSYSHNIFQALNTTGEPLNAIDTFKPEVIRYVGYQDYQQSVEYTLFEQIHDLLNSTQNKGKTKTLDKFIVDLGYILTGNKQKVSKSLKAQRQFLIDEYFAISTEKKEQKTQFVKKIRDHLYFCYSFENTNMNQEGSIYLDLDDKTKLFLHYLEKEHWNNVRPLLSVFHQHSKEEFSQAIVLLTAFFVLTQLKLVNAGIPSIMNSYWREHVSCVNLCTLKKYLHEKANENNRNLADQTAWQQRVAQNDINNSKSYILAKLSFLASFADHQLLSYEAYAMIKSKKDKEGKNKDYRFELTALGDFNHNHLERWSNTTLVPLDVNWPKQNYIGDGVENYKKALEQVEADRYYISYVKGETSFGDKRTLLEQRIKQHLFEKFKLYNDARYLAQDSIEKEQLQADVWLSNVYMTFSNILWQTTHENTLLPLETESYV